MAELNYQVNDQELENSFEALPSGDYIVVIEDSDIVQTKSGDGHYIKLTYQIIDGNFKGSKLFENINIDNPNPQAVQIAKKTLNSIGVAINLSTIKDTSEMHDVPLAITVAVRESKEYGKTNVIKKHFPIDGVKQGSTPPPSTSNSTNVGPDNHNKPRSQPWKK